MTSLVECVWCLHPDQNITKGILCFFVCIFSNVCERKIFKSYALLSSFLNVLPVDLFSDEGIRF